VHDSKSIFVRAATFGQLTKHIFDHGGGSHPNSKNLCQHGIQDLLISGKAEGKLSLCPVTSYICVRSADGDPEWADTPSDRAKLFPSRRDRRRRAAESAQSISTDRN